MSTHEQIQLTIELEQAKPILDAIGVDVRSVEHFNTARPKKPDLHIPNYEGKYIGIEVTECLTVDVATGRKKQLRRGESRLNYILRWVKQQLQKEQRYYNVSLEFSGLTHQLLAQEKYPSTIKQEILEEIIRHKETDDINYYGDGDVWLKLHNQGAFNYKYVISATFHTEHPPFVMIWQVSSGGVKCIEEDYVSQRIEEKETKLPEYKRLNPKIDEFWLCIFIEDREFRSIDAYPVNKHTSNYDRIYLTSRGEYKRIK